MMNKDRSSQRTDLGRLVGIACIPIVYSYLVMIKTQVITQ